MACGAQSGEPRQGIVHKRNPRLSKRHGEFTQGFVGLNRNNISAQGCKPVGITTGTRADVAGQAGGGWQQKTPILVHILSINRRIALKEGICILGVIVHAMLPTLVN